MANVFDRLDRIEKNQTQGKRDKRSALDRLDQIQPVKDTAKKVDADSLSRAKTTPQKQTKAHTTAQGSKRKSFFSYDHKATSGYGQANRSPMGEVPRNAVRAEKKAEDQNGEKFSVGKLAGGMAVKGATDFAKSISGTLSFLEGAVTKPLDQLMGAEGEFVESGMFHKLNEDIKAEQEAAREYFQPNVERGGKAAEIADFLGTTTISAIPQGLMATVAGSTKAAQTGVDVVAKAKDLAPGIWNSVRSLAARSAKDPAFWSSFFQTIGNDYEEAIADGASELKAVSYAIGNGLLNAQVEVGGGLETMDEAGDMGIKAWAKAAAEEGNEEVIQGIIQRSLQNLVYEKGNPIVSVSDENAVLNPMTSAQEWAGGAFAGGVLSGARIGGNYLAGRAYNRQLANIGSDYQVEPEALVKEGLSFPQGTEARRTAEQMQEKINSGTALTDADLGKMVAANEQTMYQQRQLEWANTPAEERAADGDRALLETARSMTREQQETDSRNGQTAERDESRIGRDIQDNMERVRRAAGALGESGGKALTAAYTEDTAKMIAPKEAVEGFYKVYNAALKGEQLADTDARSAAVLPAHLRYAAQSAGQQDALRAKQAKFFGEKAGLVKDDSWKKAHLSSKTNRTLDALGKALGVQIKFTETVAEGTANGQYADGAITLALDGENPVMTTVTHEAVHRLREISPESYSALADFVRGNLSEETTDLSLQFRKRLNQSDDVNAMTEEMVADAFGRVLNDGKAIEQLVQDNRSLAEKVRDVLADIVNAVKRVLNHQDLELTAEQKAEFRELESRMGEMERLFADALGKAALQTETSNGTMSATNNSIQEVGTNGRGKAGSGGLQESSGGESGQAIDGERNKGTGGVRGELSSSSGRYGGVNPTFGTKPVRTWAEGHTVEPARGSVAHAEQQAAVGYGVPSFVVADEAWAKNKGNTPAFSVGGQIYLRENLPEKNKGMYVPHEVTHVMKQVGYQPYLDFVERTPEMLNMSDTLTRQLLDHTAKHQGLGTTDADPVRLYDELNATIYGHYSANKMDGLDASLHQVFHDFDAYISELNEIHEQFKAENGKGKKYSLKEYTAEEKKQHVKDALAYFGRTFKWAETGYITTDGKRLDFSGRHDGAPGGYRTVDHRDISDALGLDYGGDDYSGAMVQFMGEGNIRISPESGGINLSVMPTKAQLDTLSDFISKQRGEVILDLDAPGGDTVSSTEYPRGTHANKVLGDIKAYFEEGKQPQVSEVARFRYSLKEVSPVKPTSDDWRPGATFDEVKAAHPTLFALDADEADTRNPTQISGTVKSYRKIYDALRAENFDGTILDASSGLGYGTRAGREEYGFDVDDIEPFPDAKYQPNYTDYSTLDKTYDVIISNAVLNVMPQDLRDAMVVKIGEMLNPGGRAFINVRGTDVKNAGSKIAINDDLMEYFISNTGSYQKGFTSKELVSYLKDALGDGFTVEPTRKFGAVSAIVTRDGDTQQYSRKEKAMLEAFRKEYGTIPKGETPSREILLPRKTATDKKVSQTVRTILEAGATPEGMVPTVEDMVAKGDFSYEAYSDKKAISDAESQIKKVGWAQALTDWTSAVKSGEVSKANTAMGWALYNNAANSNDTKTALTVLNQMVEHQRSAAQALQATRILKSMSPETQLYGVQRSVENLQEELNKRYGDKKGPELKIDEDLAERFMKAKDQESRDELLKEIYRDIGRQMPSRFIDRWNAWRYLAMLGNTRTHVRNIVGNAGFMPVVATKNLVGTAIESAVYRVSGGKLNRSKALVWGGKQDRALLSAAWGDYAKVQEAALGGGKYSEFANANRYIEEGRKIFGNTKIGLWNATGGKALETFRKANSAALDVEDVWFSKPHYAYALSQYCKAHNITAEQIASGKGLRAAREYAILEAQKATYRDTNAFSQTISDLGRGSKAGKNKAKKAVATIMEGILPFRKTPANILARGVEYSPIGLANGIKEALWDVQKGTKTGAEAIDAISAGLSGTGLLALGLYMAAQGLVRGHGGNDDKKKKFEEMQGHQAYALELPDGRSVTLDWLAPEALPFFIGVNLWEETGGERATLSDWMTSTKLVTEPLLEMSCLQSLNAVFDAVGYASSEGLDGLPAALASAGTSYLTQALPTVLGQAERTGEDKRYTTYTEKNAFLTGDIQYTLGKASARVPGWDYQQIPYIDAWGRTEASGNAGTRAFNNFVNPAYTSQIQTSEMEKELLRLYEATGESGVFPQRAEKYFTVDQERKDLTAQEYVKYAALKGQSAYQLVTDLVKDKKYQAMSDQDKAVAVENAYKLANQQAKAKIAGYEPESWIVKAAEAEKKHGIDQETYVLLKTQTAGIESLKDKDGETISNSKGLQIMELVYGYTGLSDKQKEAMFEYLGVGKTIRHYNPGKVKQELEKMKKK